MWSRAVVPERCVRRIAVALACHVEAGRIAGPSSPGFAAKCQTRIPIQGERGWGSRVGKFAQIRLSQGSSASRRAATKTGAVVATCVAIEPIAARTFGTCSSPLGACMRCGRRWCCVRCGVVGARSSGASRRLASEASQAPAPLGRARLLLCVGLGPCWWATPPPPSGRWRRAFSAETRRLAGLCRHA